MGLALEGLFVFNDEKEALVIFIVLKLLIPSTISLYILLFVNKLFTYYMRCIIKQKKHNVLSIM